jgi:signal peptidase II
MYIRRLVVISLITVLLDQIAKQMVMAWMSIGQSIPILDGFLNLSYVRNPGAAFGFLSSSSEAFRVPFFIGISVVAIGAIVFFYVREAQESLLMQVGLSLVMGGAVGNLIDRIRFQEVVDFLDVYYKQFHWPAFNVADSAISVGVSVLILDMFISGTRKKREEP